MEGTLEHWVIYDHPADDPAHIVVRRWTVDASGPAPREATSVQTVEEAREFIAERAPGTVCLTRSPDDDPTIVEVWL